MSLLQVNLLLLTLQELKYFSGWYAGASGVSLKKENSLITIISGSLYQDVPRNNGLELVTHFIASVSDFQGTPTVSNVSHSVVRW